MINHRKMLLIAGVACSNAFAALTLQVNPTDKTWSLVGSDSGTLESINGFGLVEWRAINVGGSGYGITQLRTESMWSSNVGEVGALNFSNTDTQLESGQAESGNVSLILTNELSVFQTIIGSGSPQSYGVNSPSDSIARVDFDSGGIARLEGFIGSSLQLTRGSGFSNISVVAIPEPASFGFLTGIFALGTILMRRRR